MEMRELLKNWNKVISESVQLLEEGIEDLGLPQVVVDEVNRVLVDTSPKTKTWFGNLIKKYIDEASMIYEMRASLKDARDVIAAAREQIGDNEGSQKLSNVDEDFLAQIDKVNSFEKLTYDERRKIVRLIASFYTKLLPSLNVKMAQDKVDHEVNYAQRYFITDPLTITIRKFETLTTALRKEESATMQAVQPIAESSSPIFRINDAARAILEAEENEEQVVHKFDNGFYWYDLQTTHCSIEAERLKNCGSDSRGNLYSLRWKGAKDKQSKSFVLISYNSSENKIYQIKGFEMVGEVKYGNRAPPKAIKGPKGQEANLWDMIAWFINHFDVEEVVETGEYVNGEENIEKFQVMNEYLSSRTSANFSDPEDKFEETRQECLQIQLSWADRLEYFSTYFDVDHEDPQYPYVYFSAVGDLPIEVGELDVDLNNTSFERDLLEAISEYIKNQIDGSLDVEKAYNKQITQEGDTLFFPISIRNPDADPDPDGYERFCDKLDDIERAIVNLSLSVKTDLEVNGWIHAMSGDFDEFVNYELQELEDQFEHIKIRWDEADPAEGVVFSLMKDTSGAYGVSYSFGKYKDVFAPYAVDTVGLADNAYEAAFQKTMRDFHETAVSFLEKELKTVQRQAVSQLEVPVGKEPAKSYSAANVENVEVSLHRSASDDLNLMIKVVIGSFSEKEQLTSIIAMARFLDENAEQIVALLKQNFDSQLRANFDKIGLDQSDIDLVESIARAIIKRVKW